MPEKLTPPERITPVSVTVIGGTGDGGLPITTGTIATTPSSQQANIVVTVVTPLAAILIRFVNNYLTILVGLVAAGMTSNAIPSADFLDLVAKCAGLSVAGAGFAALKDLVTIVGRLETKYPLLTGNV